MISSPSPARPGDGAAPRRAAALLGLAALIGVLAPTAASAYGVIVNSSASAGGIYNGGSGSCRYGVNGQGGNCSTSVAHYGGQSSAAVTPANGRTDATFVSAKEYAAGAGASATSAASVDLSTASLHLYGADSNVTDNCSTVLPCGGTNNSGSFNDVLHFAVAGAGASTVTAIRLTLTVEGSMNNQFTAVDGNASGEIYGGLNFGSSDARFDLYSNSSTGYQTKVNYLDTYPSDYPGVWTSNPSLTSNVYTETYNLTGPTDNVAVALGATLLCQEGYICNYANTAKIALSLPSDVTFTSDSGVFLDGATSGVPEPAGWAVMLLGLGLVGGATRRRRSGILA